MAYAKPCMTSFDASFDACYGDAARSFTSTPMPSWRRLDRVGLGLMTALFVHGAFFVGFYVLSHGIFFMGDVFWRHVLLFSMVCLLEMRALACLSRCVEEEAQWFSLRGVAHGRVVAIAFNALFLLKIAVWSSS